MEINKYKWDKYGCLTDLQLISLSLSSTNFHFIKFKEDTK